MADRVSSSDEAVRAAACQGFIIRERPDHQPLGPCLHCGKTYQQHRATDPVNAEAKHCPSCTCGHRAPVQGDHARADRPDRTAHADGSISWAEHLEAWNDYGSRYGQSAERIAERGGFSYYELVTHLGHEPTTWVPGRVAWRGPEVAR